jgi:hypothetical protein
MIAMALPARAMDRPEDLDQFLAEKLEHWQKRLKLEEWTVTITVARKSELKARTTGGIKWDKRKHTAAMVVLDPSDYKDLSEAAMLDDLEFTIVHELVHLELASLPKSEASRSTEEFAVNRIADALLGR